jgi:hypothetical protein
MVRWLQLGCHMGSPSRVGWYGSRPLQATQYPWNTVSTEGLGWLGLAREQACRAQASRARGAQPFLVLILLVLIVILILILVPQVFLELFFLLPLWLPGMDTEDPPSGKIQACPRPTTRSTLAPVLVFSSENGES